MHREKYWSSKAPLPLALLFLFNVFLVAAVQILAFYPYPAQPDATSLEKYDPVYEECRILIGDSVNYLTATLAETKDGQTHLVVTKAHAVAYGRGKIIYAKPVEIPASGECVISVKNGIHTNEIRIKVIPTGEPTVTISYGYSGGIREAAPLFMLLAALLEALELIVFHLIKQNLT